MSCVWRDITIAVDAGWDDSFWLLDGNQPVDLSGKRVELYVLPAFDWAGTPIRLLNSLSGGEIVIDHATKGAISIAVTQANVSAHLPVGTWKYFLRVLNGPADVVEYQRGNLIVLAGRTS
jgi:hypothetical protein